MELEGYHRTPGRKEVVYLPMAALHANQYNPGIRMEEGRIKSLAKSIREDGLQYPILVSKRAEDEYEIIDGHRRFACLTADKHEFMPCIVADGNSSKLFSVVNATSSPLSGREWALVFVRGGTLPRGVTNNNLTALAKLIGNDGIRDMAEKGLSPGVYQTARRVANYVYGSSTDPDVLRKIITWLIDRRQTSNCLAVVNGRRDPQLIKDALEGDRAVNALA